MTPITWAVLDLHAWHKRTGALPYSGGLFDQPVWLMRAFAIIDEILRAKVPTHGD